jgi:uncharacterized delta-60 repeat protein
VIGRRSLVRGAAALCALLAGAGTAIALAGSGGLDPSFGTAGTTVFERPTSTFPTPTVLAPGGKIVVLSSANEKLTVSRLLPNGAPDPTFGGVGHTVIESPGAYLGAYGVAIQPDGKIVVVGYRSTGEADAMVWRLNADGGTGTPNSALDPTFDTDGIAQLDSSSFDVARAVVIQPDGKIVVAGTTFTSPNQTVAVWRLNANGGSGAINGALDHTFDTDGVAGISDGTSDQANAVALRPDGKIIVAGSTALATSVNDAVVWRVKANGGSGELNGALDHSFDADGQADVDNGGNETANAVALQPDGKIVIAGSTDNAPHGGAGMVWRLQGDGAASNTTNDALDPTFDADGAAMIDSGGYARAIAVALQPDGKILLAGETKIGTNPYAAAVWRLAANGGAGTINGALDPTFGGGGAATVNAATGAGASALALGPDRRIIAAGATFTENLLVFRVLGDPFAVSVAKAGAGSGSVRSSPAGIDCGGACSGLFDDGAEVTLTATAAGGSAFVGWSGAGCSGAGTCALAMSADRTVTATFNALPPTPPPRKPTISALHESNSSFRVGHSSTPLSGHASAKRHRRGTVFSFQLDQAAMVKIAIQKSMRGRRLGRSCRAAVRRLRHKPRCTRTITIGTLTRTAHAGLNRVSFSGRIRGKALAPGRYQVTFTAANSAGVSSPKTLSFAIVRR